MTEEITLEQFRKRMKIARVEKDWTQRDLAFNSEISLTIICQVENGTRKPTEKTVRAICRAMDMKVPTILDL